jgi:hypothetical protein
MSPALLIDAIFLILLLEVLRLNRLHALHVNCLIMILLHEHIYVVTALMIKLVGHLR